jgi:dTDP-4-amino-4,6-dideoxygalactose transaminase
MKNKNIFVTQPTLAPLAEFTALLEGVWERGILTHNGPLVQQFETELAQKLAIPHFTVVNNGTVALQIAIKSLALEGEIITTPFTWIATVSAIQWEGCSPIFCDIDPKTLNIDPSKIEALITKNTVAIMPVHVFGNPCDVDAIERIAKKHNLKVIYDAAHAIGSTYQEKSLLTYGDVSATSLHATKLLNTAEGGGCITTDLDLDKKIKRIRFFGHSDDKTDIVEEGCNGKLTEIHAALGLANLNYYDAVLEDRKNKYFFYKENLQELPFLTFQEVVFGTPNYSYFPIIFDSEARLLAYVAKLLANSIVPRRYFYPSVNTYSKVVAYQPCPISEDVSTRILCLPLYYGLALSDMERIISILKETL